MYNPANFSVNYAASSNYSNSSNYANGAGYADSLRVNGSVVDPNSLGIYIATYTGMDDNYVSIFSCPGFTQTNGLKVILKNSPVYPEKRVTCKVKINNINLTIPAKPSIDGAYMYSNALYYVEGTELVIVNADFKYDCNNDCRCGDDGF